MMSDATNGSSADAPLVLVVEDEHSILAMLRYSLEAEGYRCAEAHNGEEAVLKIEEENPDLMVLDWMMPVLSGVEVCRQVRRSPDHRKLPIVMLTAKREESDKIRGLDAGADDYITKPFSPAELIARVRALLRRSKPDGFVERLAYANLEMDLAAHRVRRGPREVHLGPTDYRLLRHFLQSPRRVFSREQLLDAVWGRNVYVEPRTVDVHIRRLRKALNAKGEADLGNLDLTGKKILLVIGGEAKAVGQYILNLADHTVSIGMFGRINSLNASVAAGIAMHRLAQ